MVVSVRVSDILSRTLYEIGCRYAFGMSGGEVLTLIDSLESSGISFISTSHENSGGFMAEGVYHASGSPAILVATLGPGAMNCVNVVANAYQDKVPMLVLTGCIDPSDSGIYTHQVMDHSSVFSSIVRSSYVLSVDGCADTIASAISDAYSFPYGPVHIDIPVSVAASSTSASIPVIPPTPIPYATDTDIARISDLLISSQHPLALIGMDSLSPDSSDSLLTFLERFSIPFLCTYKAKGIVSEHHELCLGCAGLSPLADEHLLPLVRSSDLVFCLGYDPIEMRIGWRDPWDITQCSVIEISPYFSSHGMHRSTFRVQADISTTLDSVCGFCDCDPKSENPLFRPTLSSLSSSFSTDESWGPSAIISESQSVLPPETISTVDSGAHRILLSQLWRCESSSTLLQSTAFCTMGCAIPLAMGYKLHSPTIPVVSFCGDAGLLMVAGELSNASTLGGPLIFVIFVDSSLALIDMKQRSRQLRRIGVDVPSHNFSLLAQSFGGSGIDVYTRSELRSALEQGLSSDTFTLISAFIPKSSYDGKF